jgi:L-asparaginase
LIDPDPIRSQINSFALENHYMAIRIFVTGGTFDKEYNEITGQLFFKDTHLPEMIARSRVTPQVIVTTLMMIDSLDMKPVDRELIVNQCNNSPEDKIIITHGTDTMSVTAAVLADKVPGKTIVLTGAMIPYKFGSSDGFFNLGCALAFVQTLPHAVYVSMNGRYFNWDNVRKNRITGQFEEVR